MLGDGMEVVMTVAIQDPALALQVHLDTDLAHTALPAQGLVPALQASRYLRW